MTKLKDLEGHVEMLINHYHRVRSHPKFHTKQLYEYKIHIQDPRTKVLEWMNQNCQGNYSLDDYLGNQRTVSFVLLSDATLVMLTWGGTL